jgi:hypothetical protein
MTFSQHLLLAVITVALGAAAGAFVNYLMNRKPVSLHAKLVNFTQNQHSSFTSTSLDGDTVKLLGTRYFLRLAVVALNQEFKVEACSVAVKYTGVQAPLLGKLYRHYRDLYHLGSDIGWKKLKMPSSSPNLSSLSVLAKNQVTDCYATAIVENPPDPALEATRRGTGLEWMELRFTDLGGSTKPVRFLAKDIDPYVVYYDPAIWIDLTPQDIAFLQEL